MSCCLEFYRKQMNNKTMQNFAYEQPLFLYLLFTNATKVKRASFLNDRDQVLLIYFGCSVGSYFRGVGPYHQFTSSQLNS